jgi:hypothetical protein
MILVHIPHGYPKVQRQEASLKLVTTGNWAGISDDAIEEYGDILAGIYQDRIVSIYRITGYARIVDELSPDNGRVVFEVDKAPDLEKKYLETPNPGKRWGRGMARPVQYIQTDVLYGGSVPVAEVATNDGSSRRAVVEGFILTVDDEGNGIISVPAGSSLLVAPKD